MMRNLIVLGCAGLLAIGLSLTGYAGVGSDVDNDGVPDAHDNCTTTPNGPLGSSPSGQPAPNCDAQEDGDLDGYGNPCDSDVDNIGFSDATDIFLIFDDVDVSGTVPEFDLNCNGFSDSDDLFQAFDETNASVVPGPSGLACATANPANPPCPGL